MDPKLALLLLEKGVELGNIDFMIVMARYYENFINDKRCAFDMYNMALYKSICEDDFYFRDVAYNELGCCYQNGIGVDRDIDKAIDCYRKSYCNAAFRRLCKLNAVY